LLCTGGGSRRELNTLKRALKIEKKDTADDQEESPETKWKWMRERAGAGGWVSMRAEQKPGRLQNAPACRRGNKKVRPGRAKIRENILRWDLNQKGYIAQKRNERVG